MRTFQKRVQTLEDNIFVDNNRELPPEILEMLRRIQSGSEGIVLSEEEQKATDQYIAELFAPMRAAGEIR